MTNRRKLTRWIVAVAVMLGTGALVSNSLAQLPPAPFEEGSRFPELTLEDVRTGQPVDVMSMLKGKRTILHIFAAW